VHDFEALAAKQGWTVERSLYLAGHRQIELLPNLLAQTAVFLFRR
jgi:hypothetical protein